MLDPVREQPVLELNAGSVDTWAGTKQPQQNATHTSADDSASTPHRKGKGGVVRILAFFVFLAVTAILLNLLVDHGLRRIRTSKFGSMNRIMSGEVNADIVINGSSRALDHYDPRIIESVTGHTGYNLGMNASQTDLQLAVLKAYLAHNAKPRVVIQNLDPFTFVTTRRGDIYDPGYYVPYLWDNDLCEGLRVIDPVVLKWKYIPLYGYSVEDMRFTWLTGLLGAVGVNPKEDYFQGFDPQYRPWTADFDRFKKEQTDGFTPPIEAAAVGDLEAIAQLCRDRGIQLIFVYSPEFAEVQELERNRGEIFTKFREIAAKYQVPFWDYSNAPICKEQKYFYNSQHLNADGAAVFSADLAQKLRDSHVGGI